MNNSLQKLSQARQWLAEAKDLNDVKHIIDVAEAARAYSRAAKLGLEAQNEAAEICIRAKRKAGEMFAQLETVAGARTDLTSSDDGRGSKQEQLKEIGVTVQDAHRWEQIATLPEETFEEVIAETIAQEKELTTSIMLRAAREENNSKKEPLPIPDGKYRIIYADPPWKYNSGNQHSREEQDTVLGTYYPSMSIKELCELPIKHIAFDNSVLFLWVTSPLLAECFDVIKAWGFEYKASIVWNKDAHNVGHYVSVRHEFLLICTRGSCTPDSDKLLPSVVTEKRTEHSVKPETFRNMIDAMYPEGKRIELFARRAVDGWEAWGNEPVIS